MPRLSVVVALFMAWAELAQAAADGPTIQAVRLARPPAMDGHVSTDSQWQGVPAVGGFVLLGSGEPARAGTAVRVAYDGERLYVGWVCRLPAGKAIEAKKRGRDKDVYVDECVELFLAPHARHPDRYLHFILNALESVQDELGRDPSWNPRWQARAVAVKGGWEGEMAIPWGELPVTTATGSTWRVNFCRHSPAVGENSSWAPCKQTFHEPSGFGRLTGLEVDFSPYVRGRVVALANALAGRAEALSRTEGDSAIASRARLLGRRLLRRVDELLNRIADRGDVRQGDEQRLMDIHRELAAAERLAGRVELAEEARRMHGEGEWAVCIESPMRKIPQYEAYAGRPAREALVELARNEYEGLQLVIVSLGNALEDVAVDVGELKGPGGATISAQDIAVRRIGYVDVKKPSGKAPLKPGLLPDPLLPYQPFDVSANGLVPVLLTIYARPDQRPGQYSGAVTVRPRGRRPWTVRLTVRVWGFCLPRRSFLRTCFNLQPWYLARYHDVWDGKTPPGWQLMKWTGADMRGIPDYFGDAEFDHGVVEEQPHSGQRCAWISCTQWRKGTHEGPRAAYVFSRRLRPGPYRLRFAYRTADDKTRVNFGVGGVTWQALPPSKQWKMVVHQFRIPEQREVYFYLRLESTGKVWFDDVSLVDESGAELVENGGFERVGRMTMDELLRTYRLNMLAHRASDMNVAAPRIETDGDKVRLDWTDFDREMAEYVRLGQNAFNIYWTGIRGGWGKVAELSEADPATRRAAEILRQTQRHLADKGWLDLGYLYVIDEPSWKYFDQVKKIFGFVHEVAPGIKRLLTYGYGASRPIQPGKPRYADLAGFVDIHVPHSDCFEPLYLRQRQEMGEEVWVYVCISAQRPYLNIWGIDYPGTDHRVLFWQIYRSGATGFLYWAVTYWKEDPWKNPMTYPGGNADGSLLYPGPEGPIDSLRWEITRDGIEDYDYLKLAETWANRLRKAGRAAVAAELEAACRTDDVTRGWTQYTDDPVVIMQHRRRLGAALSRAAQVLGEGE